MLYSKNVHTLGIQSQQHAFPRRLLLVAKKVIDLTHKTQHTHKHTQTRTQTKQTQKKPKTKKLTAKYKPKKHNYMQKKHTWIKKQNEKKPKK